MAVTLGKSPVLMTEAGDSIGNDGKHWFVTSIKVVAGANSGKFSILDKSGGQEIFASQQVSANGMDWMELHHVIDGAYVDSMPLGGKVFIYYR